MWGWKFQFSTFFNKISVTKDFGIVKIKDYLLNNECNYWISSSFIDTEDFPVVSYVFMLKLSKKDGQKCFTQLFF